MKAKKLIAFLLLGMLVLGGIVPAYAEDMPEPDPDPILTEELAALPADVVTDPATSTPDLPQEEVSTTTETVEVLFIEEIIVESVETQEIIVKFKETKIDLERAAGQEESEELATSEDLAVEEHIEGANVSVFSTNSTESAETAIARLEESPLVEYAEPNYIRSFMAISPDDASFSDQWALKNTGQTYNSVAGTVDADIRATEAWDLSLGTSTIVAVIDNGFLYDHPDLTESMWDGSECVSDTGAVLGSCVHGYDFADDDLSPAPAATTTSDNTHGTHVAGIIGAQMNNSIGVAGVAPEAKIMALRFDLDVASEVRAIDFAIQNGAKIINASYGGTTFSQSEYDAIERFEAVGGVFVAAAGNTGVDNDSVPMYPASYDLPNIISVAATDHTDTLASFSSGASSYGEESVDLGAPGRFIRSTITNDGTDASYGRLSGTSMAAPHVAGAAALLRSLYPDAGHATIKDALLSSGHALSSLSGKTVSGKRLDAFAALDYLADDITPPVITLTGSASVSLTVGDTYTEQGATAIDNIDGSVDVTIDGDTVATSTVGTYTVTYDAQDAAGNHAVQKSRTVTVSAAAVEEEEEETPRRRSGGGGGGGGGSRSTVIDNPARTLFAADSPYASMTPEARAQLLQTLLTLLMKLQAQLATLRAAGL